MINILFSTTRQFNPGDEFILYGIINCIKKSLNGNMINSIIFNRNPDISQNIDTIFTRTRINKMNFKGKGFISSFIRMNKWDNSIRMDSDWSHIDLIVFAGSPEWYGKKCKIIYKNSIKYKIPVVYIGIGAGEKNIANRLSDIEKKILNQALYITTRDNETIQVLETCIKDTTKIKQIACPSMCSSNIVKQVTSVKKIALIYSSSRCSSNNNISKSTELYIKRLYLELKKKYNVALVCHYIEELDYVEQDFPGIEYYYSYDSHEYFDIYKSFDFVIGCRVHGIGICASIGIPGIIIKHSIRCNTVLNLGAGILVPGEKQIEDDIDYIEKK